MKRRSTVSQLAIRQESRVADALLVSDLKGSVSPVSGEKRSITLRLSGPWAKLWNQLRKAVPGTSEAELLRQGVALRATLAARDAKGQKPTAWIEYHDEAGKLVRANLEEHVGIAGPAPRGGRSGSVDRS